MRPSLRDRAIAAVARALTRGFFRSVETVGTAPRGGPVILAASHLNGFVDPVVLVSELGVLPRFLAKATLWDVVVARPLLSFARIIPVQRRQDGDGNVDNRATFAAAVDALASGHLVAVFPEGTTHDLPALQPLRTGVARIAVQAAADGVPVRVVPVGVTYEDKVAVRGRTLVHFGEPVAVPAGVPLLDADGAPAPEPVRGLTSELTAALNRLTPHFASTEEALALAAAARISLRTDEPATRGGVPLARATERARRITGAGPAAVARVVSAVARYQMLLGFVHLTDEELVARHSLRTVARRAVGLAVLVVVLAPFALAGLFANLVPAVGVLVVGVVPSAPVTKGTVRVLVAAVLFPLTWLLIAVWDVGAGLIAQATQVVTFPLEPVLAAGFDDRSGFWSSLLVFVTLPLLGLVAVFVADRARALAHDVEAWWTLSNRRGQLAEVRTLRGEVVTATAAALGDTRRELAGGG